MEVDLQKLKQDSLRIRCEIVDIAATPTGCHIGGSLSVTDILNCTFAIFGRTKTNTIVLSKGHAAAGLYATLFIKGYLFEKPSLSYGRKNSLLLGHPNELVNGIDFATGSLGHGLGYATGWALGTRLRHIDGTAIAISGDGELEEGSIWETMQVISSKHINNLIYIIDRNGGQNDGFVSEISPMRNLEERFSSFGFVVKNIDGHNLEQLVTVLQNKPSDKPLAIIANTVKAKGIRVMEGNPKSHYAKITEQQAQKWKLQMRIRYENTAN